MDARVLAFVGVALVLVLTPGAALALVMKNTALAGRRAGLWTIAGLATAVVVHATASALGLSAVLARSAMAFAIVKYLGAAYLFGLGVEALWRTWARGTHASKTEALEGEVPSAEDLPERGRGYYFRVGWLINVLNPKPALFYLAVLPQFIAPGEPVLGMSLLFVGMHIGLLGAWYMLCVQFVTSLRAVLARPSVKRAIDRAFGGILIALGARVAVE